MKSFNRTKLTTNSAKAKLFNVKDMSSEVLQHQNLNLVVLK